MAPNVYPRLLIDADTTEADEFVLDTSVIGTDALASSPSYVYVDDDHIRALSIRRGGRRWQYDTGEVVVTLDNRSGDYNPDNNASTYGHNGRSLIQAGMLAQVILRTDDTTETTAFTGRLADAAVNHDPIMPTVTWVFEDALAEMGAVDISDAEGAVDQSMEIIGDLVDEHGYGSWSAYHTPFGKDVVRPGSMSLRQALQQIVNSDMGRFYVDVNGTPQFERWDEEDGKVAQMTFQSDGTLAYSQGVTTDPGLSSTFAEVQVNWPNGDPVVRASTSERTSRYGMRRLKVDTRLDDMGDAEDLAQQLADIHGRTVTKVTGLVCDPTTWDDPVWAALLRTSVAGLELGELVDVQLLDGDTIAEASVERIDWDFAPGRCRLRLGLEGYQYGGYGNADWFVVGSSALDGTDVLAY